MVYGVVGLTRAGVLVKELTKYSSYTCIIKDVHSVGFRRHLSYTCSILICSHSFVKLLAADFDLSLTDVVVAP